MGVGLVKYIGVVFLILMALATVSACSINIDNQRVELRSNTDGYATNISAEDASPIDIKVSFDITDVSGSACPTDVKVKSTIYRESDTVSWQSFRTTSTKIEGLSEDSYTLTWTDDFTVSDSYTRYRVDTNIFDSNNNVLDTVEGYIDLENNNCSGIQLVASNFTLDEGQSSTRSFRIENNTNKTFEVSSMNVLFSTSLITSGSTDYDSTVDPYNDNIVDVTLDSGYTSYNTSTTGTFSVSGYLGSTYCSSTAIGTKSFTVTVQDTGSSGSNSSSSSSGSCSDISFITKNFDIAENSETTQIFYLQNNSTKRFELTDVQIVNSGLDLRTYYYEQYAFPGEVANIILKGTAPNVFSNKAYETTIKAQGKFSDGKTCSFDNISKKTFTVTVVDSGSSVSTSAAPNCSNFTISVPESISVENFGNIPISITNGTNQRADIYLEGTVDASVSQISLPENSSISREINVSLTGSNGELILRPSVGSCYFASKRISIQNTAKGELSLLSMTTTTEVDQNTGVITLFVTVDNPTSRIFPGILSVNGPNGWYSNDKEVTVTPGKNSFSLQLNKTANAENGNILVSFKANGSQITSTLDSGVTTGGIGLFAFGGGLGSLLALIFIIVIVLLIVGLISAVTKPDAKDEPWVEGNN